jgi:ankyrin repeat protein
MAYAYGGSDPTAFEFFLKNGASVDQADNKGNTALMNAAGFNNIEIIKLLTNVSTNPNIVNKKGQSALMMATQHNSSDAMSLLLAKGAKAPIFDTDGNGALYYLVQSYNSKEEEDFYKKMKLLKNNRVDFRATEPTGNSLFHLAADKDITSLLEIANEGGLDVNAKNKEGMTPLLIAAMKSKDGESLKYLVSIGADTSITTDFEESAYQLASENELLQRTKFDINFLAK